MAPWFGISLGRIAFDASLWKALDEVFPGTRHQRCWVHKTANVLNKFPKSMAPAVKSDLQDIHHAETRADAKAALTRFEEKYAAKFDKAAACLTRDKEALLAFYDFPAEHWDHLRTSNPIESVFATVRHRPPSSAIVRHRPPSSAIVRHRPPSSAIVLCAPRARCRRKPSS